MRLPEFFFQIGNYGNLIRGKKLLFGNSSNHFLGAAAGTNLWKSEGDCPNASSINSKRNGGNTGFF